MVAPNVETVARLAMELSIEDRRELMRVVASSVEHVEQPAKPSQSLRGIWKDAGPADFDDEAAEASIREARTEWEAEIEPTITGEGEIP